MRILAIDYGTKRIGLAVSDSLGIISQGLETLAHPSSPEALLGKIGAAVKRHQVSKIVLGLPLNMNGTRGPQARQVEVLAESLRQALALPVELWDERLTTASVQRHFREWKLSPTKQKGLVDRLSAQLILQGYLDAQKGKGS